MNELDRTGPLDITQMSDLQVCKVAIYGLKRFWKLHWKVIVISIIIGVTAGVIIMKMRVKNKKRRL